MAVTTTNRSHISGFRGIFAPFISAVIAWNDQRATRAALSQLSDRELDDIGLSRGEIDHVARSL